MSVQNLAVSLVLLHHMMQCLRTLAPHTFAAARKRTEWDLQQEFATLDWLFYAAAHAQLTLTLTLMLTLIPFQQPQKPLPDLTADTDYDTLTMTSATPVHTNCFDDLLTAAKAVTRKVAIEISWYRGKNRDHGNWLHKINTMYRRLIF
jgi:hypothetical protein